MKVRKGVDLHVGDESDELSSDWRYWVNEIEKDLGIKWNGDVELFLEELSRIGIVATNEINDFKKMVG